MFSRRSSRLLIILVFCFISRLGFSLLFSPYKQEEYWEYGLIAHNLQTFGSYSFYETGGGYVNAEFSPQSPKQPSAFMMPGYTFFLYPFLSISDIPLRNILLLSVHALAACACCWLLYRLSLRIFAEHAGREKIGLLAAAIYAIVPEFMYASGTVTPTIFTQVLCCSTALLWFEKGYSTRTLLLVTLNSAIMIMIRAEALSYMLLLVGVGMFSKRQAYALGTIVGLALVLVPWTLRNTTVFHQPVVLTTSSGMNLYKGHNPVAFLNRGDSTLFAELGKLPNNEYLELRMDSLYRAKAIETIRTNPLREAGLTVMKFIHLWFMDFGDRRTAHPLYSGPWFIILLLSILGTLRLRSQGLHYSLPLWLWLAQYTFSSTVFFAIPRYQTMMKIALLPLCAFMALELYEQYRNRRLQKSA